MLHLARPDPERQRAERAVGARMAVAAHDREARKRDAELRSDDVDDALARLAVGEQRHPELRAVPRERAELSPGERPLVDRATVRRHVVIDRREGPIRSPDGSSRLPQTVERLRRGHLVNEVAVDVQECPAAGKVGDDVLVPDFIEEGPHR